MRSFEINDITATIDAIGVHVEVEATNQFTGEICTASDESGFDDETGVVVATLRAVHNLLANEMQKYMKFITKPYVNPTEEYYEKCFEELLEIHTDFIDVKEALNSIFD